MSERSAAFHEAAGVLMAMAKEKTATAKREANAGKLGLALALRQEAGALRVAAGKLRDMQRTDGRK